MRERASRYHGIYEKREKKGNSTGSAGKVLVKTEEIFVPTCFHGKGFGIQAFV